MKTFFLKCDRCSSPMNHPENEELYIKTVSFSSGTKDFIVVDLCDSCINDLIRWIGKINPATGAYYQLRKL